MSRALHATRNGKPPHLTTRAAHNAAFHNTVSHHHYVNNVDAIDIRQPQTASANKRDWAGWPTISPRSGGG